MPEEPTLSNFGKVLDVFPFWRYLFNSTVVATLTVNLNVLFCSLAAYPLGKNIIFVLIISTMMIPFQLLMIPVYIISLKLGLQNTFLGMGLPHVTTAFGVFNASSVYASDIRVDESARMDRSNSFQIWRKVRIPL